MPATVRVRGGLAGLVVPEPHRHPWVRSTIFDPPISCQRWEAWPATELHLCLPPGIGFFRLRLEGAPPGGPLWRRRPVPFGQGILHPSRTNAPWPAVVEGGTHPELSDRDGTARCRAVAARRVAPAAGHGVSRPVDQRRPTGSDGVSTRDQPDPRSGALKPWTVPSSPTIQ